MFEQLKNLYVQLEVVDLQLLLCIQNNEMHNLAKHLRAREHRLQSIGLLVSDMSGNDLSMKDRAELAGMQGNAVSRSEQIRSKMGKLHLQAKKEFLNMTSTRGKPSPYAVKPKPQRRVKA